MLFVHHTYRPPMRPGRTRNALDTGDQLWRILAVLAGALLLGGDITLGAWALDQAGHTLWAISLLAVAFLTTVGLLAWHYAAAVTPPPRKEPAMTNDDWNAEEYQQQRRRGWPCPITLAAVLTACALVAALVTSVVRPRP